MAGSAMTFSYDETGPIKKIIAAWTSDDAAGTVSAATKKISGSLIKGVTDPGTPAPDANYDIAITDDESLDVLAGCQDDLANRHTTTTEEVYFFLLNYDATPIAEAVFPVLSDTLTIAVSNAGNSKQGQIILYWKPG